MDCGATELVSASKCFCGLTGRQFLPVSIYLLCSWAGVSTCPLVEEWVARVIANGGDEPSQNTQDALCVFSQGLIAAGLDTKMKTLNCFVPDSLIACRTPLIVGDGLDIYEDVGGKFATSPDVMLSVQGLKGGLGGGPGKREVLQTGLQPFTSLTHSSAGITLYHSVNAGDSDDSFHDGVMSDGSSYEFGLWTSYSGAFQSIFYCWSTGPGGTVVFSHPSRFYGYVSGNRIADDDARIYCANDSTPHAKVADNTNAETNVFRLFDVGMPVFGQWSETALHGYANWSPKQFSFFAVHDGLIESESNTFFNLIQAMRKALNGGWV